MKKINDYSLYLIITEEYGRGRCALDIAKSAIAGGADIIQLREKSKGKSELVRLGRELSQLCKGKTTAFIVNDDPALAKEVNADGVHLGQEDSKIFTVKKTREILGPDKIIGLSTSSLKEVEKANAEEIDYIGFGPIFPTVLKEKCIGTKDVAKAMRIARKPVFFIGGINLTNIDELLVKGAKNVAVIRAILEAEDITSTVKQFKSKLKQSVT